MLKKVNGDLSKLLIIIGVFLLFMYYLWSYISKSQMYLVQVTTLFSEAERLEKELIQNPPPTESDVEAAKLVVQEKGDTMFSHTFLPIKLVTINHFIG